MLTRLNHPATRLVGGIIAFIFVSLASRAFLPFLEVPLLKDIVTWVPIFPAVFVGLGLLSMIRQMDEFERKVQVDAASFALIGTLCIFLVMAIIDETPRALLFFLMVLALWLTGWIISRRRFT